MSHLYIIRGAPGSGKTTLARNMEKFGMVDCFVEADHFMTDGAGAYKFNPKKLKDCHALCLSYARDALAEGLNVAVSNTFTRLWEMDPYISLGYGFTVIVCEGKFGNVHGVPYQKVQEMRNRFEAYR